MILPLREDSLLASIAESDAGRAAGAEMGVLGGAADDGVSGVFSWLTSGEAPSVRGLLGEAMYEAGQVPGLAQSLGTMHGPEAGRGGRETARVRRRSVVDDGTDVKMGCSRLESSRWGPGQEC